VRSGTRGDSATGRRLRRRGSTSGAGSALAALRSRGVIFSGANTPTRMSRNVKAAALGDALVEQCDHAPVAAIDGDQGARVERHLWRSRQRALCPCYLPLVGCAVFGLQVVDQRSERLSLFLFCQCACDVARNGACFTAPYRALDLRQLLSRQRDCDFSRCHTAITPGARQAAAPQIQPKLLSNKPALGKLLLIELWKVITDLVQRSSRTRENVK
jgi:hypothetical protein